MTSALLRIAICPAIYIKQSATLLSAKQKGGRCRFFFVFHQSAWLSRTGSSARPCSPIPRTARHKTEPVPAEPLSAHSSRTVPNSQKSCSVSLTRVQARHAQRTRITRTMTQMTIATLPPAQKALSDCFALRQANRLKCTPSIHDRPRWSIAARWSKRPEDEGRNGAGAV